MEQDQNRLVVVRVEVSAEDAIRASSTLCGKLEFRPTAEWLSALAPAELEWLAGFVERGGPGNHGRITHLPARVFTPSGVRAAIQERMAAEAAYVGAVRDAATKAPVDQFTRHVDWRSQPSRISARTFAERNVSPYALALLMPDTDAAEYFGRGFEVEAYLETYLAQAAEKAAAKAAEEAEKAAKQAAAKAAKEAEKAAHDATIAAWVAEYGTANEKGRFAEGRLAECEIRDAVLVDGRGGNTIPRFPDLPKYVRLTAHDIEHDDDCPEDDDRFSAKDYDGPLTAQEYDRLMALRVALPAGAGARIVLREHEAICWQSTCGGRTVRRGAKVVLTWAGMTRSVEYALTPTEGEEVPAAAG